MVSRETAAVAAWSMLGPAIFFLGIVVGRVWIVIPAILWAAVLLALIESDRA